MVAILDAADARFLALLAKSANRGLAEAAETALTAIPVRFTVADVDLVKVGPKGYIHGWIFVGAHPKVGQAVHQIKKDRSGNVVSERHGQISRIAGGHVHVTWDDGKKNIVQHVHDDKHPGGLVERGKHEGGADRFSTHLAAGTSANRRKDYADAARHYDAAAEHAGDDKTRADMSARADIARAKAGSATPEPPAPRPPKAAKPEKPAPRPRPPKAKPAAGVAGGANADPLKGSKALDAPPVKLAALTAAGDPRAEALWYRTGDNRAETPSGLPGAFEMSQMMRRGGMTPAMRRRIKAIDSAMAESKLTRTIEVYRGIEADSKLGEPGRRVGREFTDKAFASATTDENHAVEFGGTVMRIRVPAGVSAIRMDDRPGSQYEHESEILLDRGLRYRIVAEYPRRGGVFGGAHVVDVEIVQ